MAEDKNPSKIKLEKLLREAGIEPSIRDIGNNMMEFSIPIYDDTKLSGIAYASFPIEGNISDSVKRKIVLDLSFFVMKLANKIIYYTLDNLQESLNTESNKIAFAFMQRTAIFHICNHKLSLEGITTERHGKQCHLVDEFKTMPLTRSVYEHLAMFYYLFDFPDNSSQRDIVWKSWLIGSKKNLLKDNDPVFKKERQKAKEEIKDLKSALRNNKLVERCISNPKGQFENCLKSNMIFSVNKNRNEYVAEKLTYDKAWKYLYGETVNMSLTYSYLSLHSHPTYNGFLEFNSQDSNIEFPLYESCFYLAYLCRLFMKQLKIDENVIVGSFTQHEQGVYSYLSNANNHNQKDNSATMEYGIVYLLTNPVMPGLVKIGMTTQEDIERRMRELYTTGVPVPFECQFACKVKKTDCAKIEKALHMAFAPQRINANREFFRIQVEQAKAILELFHHTDVTEEVSDEIENDLTDDDKAASVKAQIHRPALNFYEMGMQKGDVLMWKDDPSITVTIVSERKICYEGTETSISALSAQLKGYKSKHIAPGAHWLYKDKLLSDIYDETYPFEE